MVRRIEGEFQLTESEQVKRFLEGMVIGDKKPSIFSVTKADKYPVPNISDFNAQVEGATCFTTLDIERAYNRIRMAKKDIEKTAIITPFGLFEYMVMLFGLKDVVQTFQRYMDSLFRNFDYVYIYIDDILIGSDENSHEEAVRTISEKFHQAGLVIKVSKCRYKQTAVNFLGYTVTKEGIFPDSEKIKLILEFLQPDITKDLCPFFSIINFYKRNVPHMAEY